MMYGFTVFSNLFVYVTTWVVLHITGECDKQQVGPADAWKFRHIVYIVLSLGILATIIFHLTVRERSTNRRPEQLINYDNNSESRGNGTHCEFLRKPHLYQIAGIYMSTRLVVNVSQVLIPLYLHRTLGLAARALAIVPLAMYLGSLGAAGVQRLAPRSCSRKLNYLCGCACALAGFVWIHMPSDDIYKTYFIYLVAVLIGFGGAVMLVTSLSLTADLVGSRTEASAFVYGLMSFTDKLACGVAIALIQVYADGSGVTYYRDVLSWVCGGSAISGLVLTLLLPKLDSGSSSLIEHSSINSQDRSTSTPADVL
ncbi:major facilitator superfamily domain-containing protein 12-like isoform X2 [Plodia interpunctella]|uniref:major facilitator superfamily domain-containing protein 12-like isoform X2 n=1 Tax=Plodia interpunctella TaxID=58824 RepID=UPI0031010EEA